jgi:predicted RNA-binding protein associated with RNAse of E/G family
VVRHSYFSRDGKPIGEYFNINTPVELYPYGARYVDLVVDVIRRAGEAPFMVDREKLAFLAQTGAISPDLEQKAMEVAEGLMKHMAAS